MWPPLRRAEPPSAPGGGSVMPASVPDPEHARPPRCRIRRTGGMAVRARADAGRARDRLARRRVRLARTCARERRLGRPLLAPARPARPARAARARRVAVDPHPGRTPPRRGRPRARRRAGPCLAHRRARLARRGPLPRHPLAVDLRGAGALGVPDGADARRSSRPRHGAAARRRGRTRPRPGRAAGAGRRARDHAAGPGRPPPRALRRSPEPRTVSRGEPVAGETRTLGSSTTALTKD